MVADRSKQMLLYILYIIIVGALIFAVYLGFRPQASQNKTPNEATKGTVAPIGGSTSLAIPNGSSSGSSSSTSSTSPKSSSNTASTSTSTVSLSNTGPGNVIGVFAVSSVVGTLVYRRKLLRTMVR